MLLQQFSYLNSDIARHDMLVNVLALYFSKEWAKYLDGAKYYRMLTGKSTFINVL